MEWYKNNNKDGTITYGSYTRWDEKVFQSMIDDIIRNNYAKGTTFAHQDGFLIPVDKDSSITTFKEDVFKAVKEFKELQKQNKNLKAQAIQEWETNHPKEKKAIAEQNKADDSLINSVYFQHIDEFITKLQSIPNNISKEEKLVNVVILLSKVSLQILPDNNDLEQRLQYATKIRNTLQALGFTLQDYSGLKYSQSATLNDNRYAEDIVNNLLTIDETYPLSSLSRIADRMQERSLSWLSVRTNTPAIPTSCDEYRPSYGELNYTNASGEIETILPGTYERYDKTQLHYTHSATELEIANYLDKMYKQHIQETPIM